ncbi:DUF4249 family protein [Aquimarina sp. RZ0]|uniref:DUF4249 family protein n=1 Tax=Aquimarina sp. RZ0 TaxID=2607730 RepID=UPI0011F1CFEC|nr:DUF4249 family protein [Aquimarina sp. RZ0]KAA1243413.1 DUF4249 family protein [Aquimarina sp. RZ0]
MKYYFIVLISFLYLGCDDFGEEVDDRPSGRTQFVLINGFLSPEEPVIRIRVSKTVSIFEDISDLTTADLRDALTIKNAMVTIMNENQNEIVLTYRSESRAYEIEASEFPIIPGQKYGLKVVTEGKEFTAQSIIPTEIIDDITTTSSQIINEGGISLKFLNIQFDDVVGENSFYVVGGTVINLDNPDATATFVDFGSKQFVTDVNGDGIPISVNGQVFNANQNMEVTIRVANTEELIYETLRASFINEDQAASDLFFEPLIPPNNIQGDGGYGVFGGFRLFEKKIRL